MAKIYIGFSSSVHDPGVAMVDENGQIVFAESNERSLKCKRAWHTVPDPIGVIEPLLKRALHSDEVVAALSWSDKGLFWTPFIKIFSHIQKKRAPHIGLAARLQNFNLRQIMYKAPQSSRDMLLNLEYRLFEKWPNSSEKKLTKLSFDHHLCHAATACYTSLFDEAICLIVDGMGEGNSTSLYSYNNGDIKKMRTDSFLNMASLGNLYSSLCWACGFDPIQGEEWKVMGMAPYGKKNDDLYNLIKPMLYIKNNDLIQAPDYQKRLDKLCSMRDTYKSLLNASDLAYTSQIVFEELMVELINSIHKKYGGKNLILSGGCALNSSCNGKITTLTPYKNLHIPMAPGDDGNAIGAALLAWKKDNPFKKPPSAHTPYLGSTISNEKIEQLIKFGKMPNTHYSNFNELTEDISNELSKGKLVGWIQGLAEFGPRSLGNRSILADPRSPEVKDKLNSEVKFREEFRPFAPSILEEEASKYFHQYQYSPYMERTLVFSDIKSAQGVVHINNTGRLQSVTNELNPRYYLLIKSFYNKTGVPLLLNTSFNVMGRPIVHDVEDALGVFYTSGLDILVINDYVFRK